jgi:DNA-binding CsgD family transcriptional regulator
VVPEQVVPVEQFFRKGLNELLRRDKEPLTVNIECTISSSRQSRKRILLQLALSGSGADSIQGLWIDISHIVKDGTPKYTLLDHHQIVDHLITSREQLLKNSPLRLTNLQYNVLRYRAKGMRAKEIAQHLSISALAVYSVIRNLKDKTNMETNALIEDLKEKGLLSLTWLNICADQGLVLDIAAVTSLLHFV